MKKNSTLEQQTANIITAFKNAKVPLKFYKKNPVSGTNFIVNSPGHRKEIYLYFNDSVKIKTAICKKNRQVLLSVLEPKRKLSRNVTVLKSELKRGVESIWDSYIGISLPPRTVYSISYEMLIEPSDKVELGITATVPSSTMYFLVGFDENHCFISRLPRKVTTVEQAHKILIPEEIRNETKYIRQGEFFFVPQYELPKHKKVVHVYSNLNYAIGNSKFSTPHVADTVTTIHYADDSFDQLVIGKITSKRHKTIYLRSFYKVYKNTEILNNNSTYID